MTFLSKLSSRVICPDHLIIYVYHANPDITFNCQAPIHFLSACIMFSNIPPCTSWPTNQITASWSPHSFLLNCIIPRTQNLTISPSHELQYCIDTTCTSEPGEFRPINNPHPPIQTWRTCIIPPVLHSCVIMLFWDCIAELESDCLILIIYACKHIGT